MANFSIDRDASFPNLIALLRARAAEHGPRVAFRYLSDGETEDSRLTYEELEQRARTIAASLALAAAPGERALLFYSGGLEFIAAFWGCLYAGVVAVPVFPARLHRQIPRLLAIAADSEAALVLTTSKIRRQAEDLFKRAPELKKLQWQATDDLPAASAEQWRDPGARLETLAFLQYTSGSTAAPRGVMVTHGNLLHNLACLREVFRFSPESVGVTWLPHFHDMGLIGGLLQPLYAGGEMIVMPPSSFLQRPIRWLAAVTRYRATTMVGPNFAYELCVQKVSAEQRAALDLASVNVALCGAEPVRPDTLSQFSEAFGPCGFWQGGVSSGVRPGGSDAARFGPSRWRGALHARRCRRRTCDETGSIRRKRAPRAAASWWDAEESPRALTLPLSIPILLHDAHRTAWVKSGFRDRAWHKAIGIGRKRQARPSTRALRPAKAPSFAPATSVFSIKESSSSRDD